VVKKKIPRFLTSRKAQEIVKRAKASFRAEEQQRIRDGRPNPEEPSLDAETARFYHDF